MKAISCYIRNNVSDLTYFEKRNSIEASFDNITKLYCACTNTKMKNRTNYGLIFAHFKETFNSSRKWFEGATCPKIRKKIDSVQPDLAVPFHQENESPSINQVFA